MRARLSQFVGDMLEVRLDRHLQNMMIASLVMQLHLSKKWTLRRKGDRIGIRPPRGLRWTNVCYIDFCNECSNWMWNVDLALVKTICGWCGLGSLGLSQTPGLNYYPSPPLVWLLEMQVCFQFFHEASKHNGPFFSWSACISLKHTAIMIQIFLSAFSLFKTAYWENFQGWISQYLPPPYPRHVEKRRQKNKMNCPQNVSVIRSRVTFLLPATQVSGFIVIKTYRLRV